MDSCAAVEKMGSKMQEISIFGCENQRNVI